MSKKEKDKQKSQIEETVTGEAAAAAEENTPADESAPAEEQKSSEDTQWQDKYLRLLAEFDNYKKRTQREREQLYKDATVDAINTFLPIIDTLERAANVETSTDEAKDILDGVLAIKKQFEGILTQMGVEVIEGVGSEFDPNYHNAVMHVDDDSVGENIIVEEFARGYKYKDKVIRHSMVKVAN